MKTRRIKAALFVLSIGMMMGAVSTTGTKFVGNETPIVVKAATIENLEVVFGNASGSDGITTSSKLKEVISYGADYVSDFESIAQVYNDTKRLKIGSSKNVGKFTMKLDQTYSVVAITVNATKYGSDSGKLVINGNTVNTALSSNAADITYTYAEKTQIDSISIATTEKRAYINSINISVEATEGVTASIKAIFNTNGGSLINDQKTTESSLTVTEPATPTNPGYKFEGWYVDENLTNKASFPETISESKNYYAKWGELDLTSIGSLESGKTARVRGKVTAITAESTAFIQNGIYGTQVYVGGGLPAAFKVGNIVEFTSNVSTNGGTVQLGGSFYGDVVVSTEEAPLTIDEVVTITSLADVTAANTGRYVELKNVKLKTAYSQKANLNMNVEGSSVVLYQKNYQLVTGNEGTYNVGDYVDVKGAILKYNNTVEICLTEIKASTTYTVSFNANNGSVVSTVKVGEGEAVSQPTAPSKNATALETYKFAGWYTNENLTGEPYDFSTPVTANVDLYAKWDVEKVSISESFGDAETFVGLDFDYDIRTTYLNGYDYVPADLTTVKDSDKFATTGSLNNGVAYKLGSNSAYLVYKVEDATKPISLKVTGYASGSETLTQYSGYHFITMNEDMEVIKSLDAETFSSVNDPKTKTITIDNVGSAAYVGVICDKADSSNTFITEFAIGKETRTAYENFRNVTLSFSYEFDVSAAVDVAEVGIYYTTGSATFTDGAEALPEGGTKVVNEEKTATFTTTVAIADAVESFNTAYNVVCYVKTIDGKYYYGEEKLYDIETILEAYAELDLSEEDAAILDAFEETLYVSAVVTEAE